MSSRPPSGGLGPFPVDDETLALLDLALDPSGGRSSVGDLLDLLSGYDQSKDEPLVIEDGVAVVVEYTGGSIYHEHDVIRALIAEVRRLRRTTA